jgi:glucose/arabinose dehydrogenase
MNEQRNGFAFSRVELADNVANKGERMDEIVFGTGFGCISDIEMGPDGLLYISSLSEGAIFRLVPAEPQDSGAGIIVYAVRRRAKRTT